MLLALVSEISVIELTRKDPDDGLIDNSVVSLLDRDSSVVIITCAVTKLKLRFKIHTHIMMIYFVLGLSEVYNFHSCFIDNALCYVI